MRRRSRSHGAGLVVGSVLFAIACGDDNEPPRDPHGGGGSVGGAAGAGGDTRAGAAGAGGSEQRECLVTAPTACANPDLAYADVAPTFEQRCVVCHSGAQGGPWSLATYGHVATWRDTIRAALITCAMPPLDSGLDIPAPESELILAWIRCGMKP